MNTELIKIPSYNKILEAVSGFYGSTEIDNLIFLDADSRSSLVFMREPETLNVKASTFAKPIICRTKKGKGKNNKSIVFVFIETLGEDAFTNLLPDNNICATYKASPDKAFSFNQFTKEFKIIEND